MNKRYIESVRVSHQGNMWSDLWAKVSSIYDTLFLYMACDPSIFALPVCVNVRLECHYYSHVQQGRLNKLCKGGWPSRPYANALTVEFSGSTLAAVTVAHCKGGWKQQPPLLVTTVRAAGASSRPYSAASIVCICKSGSI